MKKIRLFVGLGALAIGGAGALVIACGGDDAAQCGAGTVLLNGVCQVASNDGSTNDGTLPVDGQVPDAPVGDSGDASTSDGGPITDAAVDAPNRCPFGTGPVMAEIPNLYFDAGTFCMDTTELTEAQYDQFLTAIGGGTGDAGTMSQTCSLNTTYLPGKPTMADFPYTYDPVKNGTLPVRGIDWCDAYAYCRWAGKRLCDRYDKSVPALTDAGNPKLYETYIACSQNQSQKYAYGNTFEAGVCPQLPYAADASPVPAGSSQCKGTAPPYSQVYELGGNLGEWLGACTTVGCMAGGGTECRIFDVNVYQGERSIFRGVRCCAD